MADSGHFGFPALPKFPRTLKTGIGAYFVTNTLKYNKKTSNFVSQRLVTKSLILTLLGHVNKISCFSSFCLQKFGEGGGYLLFIFRGQRSYATIFTGVKLGYKRRVKGKTGTTQVKKE